MNKWKLPGSVNIFEVGPRDGLQNEKKVLNLNSKMRYIEKLLSCGLREVEVGAFVREDRIPQMASTDNIFRLLHQRGYADSRKLTLWALVPNDRGFERALRADCRAIAVFTGATDTFTQKNIGMTVKESLRVFKGIAARARKEQIRIRGYVSVCWGCPYEGKVKPTRVIKLAQALLDCGIEQVSLGDTIGAATPVEVMDLLSNLRPQINRNQIAGHFHDTRGTAIANCLASLSLGVRTLDSASGGLGGCNYAPGASGNVATEDLVYMLQGMKIRVGEVDLNRLCEASQVAMRALGRAPTSRYLQAWVAGRNKLYE